ncbi:SARP family pathway specific regulatory protein [Streptomyces zinciresistens K42]|uniref:SARP family pathway specific regulatory protein n=1 Tax=Streptomyces zinciresistens K42 TaxID=700597 RepID=G2GEC8_9ACTN|nr:BTAD domain-containing putative transcriptional regulator [Streptomyces zinciresistens]EGX58153.1 SARP family pathway specific regulatory protein [Streptomyces zinciresistens K42]
MRLAFGVLGPVAAWDAAGDAVALGAPRHREVLGRLLVARGRVVPVDRLVADLWPQEPPAGAVGAVRTFVAALRRALEPDRPPRRPSRLLVTQGPGYVLHANRDAVDAWRFEATVERAGAAPPRAAVALWDAALALWRGPVLADFPSAPWAGADRARLEALRLNAVERRADALLATGSVREAAVDLEAHVAAHPWREDGWVLLATALDRSGRRGDALAALRRARRVLAEELGTDPGPGLVRAEARILRERPGAGADVPAGIADGVWSSAAAAWERSVPARSPARLHATAGLLRDLAVTGSEGLEEAHRHRQEVVAAAEATGDAELTARIIGSYDVPAVWTRADDPEGAARLVRAAARAAASLDPGRSPALRARLLSVVAVESRGDAAADGPLAGAAGPPVREPWRARAERAAEEAVRLARLSGDPALLAFALNGAFMQSFGRCGGCAGREATGRELVRLSAGHHLPGHEVLGRLMRLQALAGLGDLDAAAAEAEAADRLAARHERPLAGVFTAWFAALRACETDGWRAARPLYARALEATAGCGMPGLARGTEALVALVPVLRADGALPSPEEFARLDAGPYEPWLTPLLLAAAGSADRARQALDRVRRPPHDLLQEALWCLLARAAGAVGHLPVLRRAVEELAPARAESAGAAGGLISFGPVARHLHAAEEALA